MAKVVRLLWNEPFVLLTLDVVFSRWWGMLPSEQMQNHSNILFLCSQANVLQLNAKKYIFKIQSSCLLLRRSDLTQKGRLRLPEIELQLCPRFREKRSDADGMFWKGICISVHLSLKLGLINAISIPLRSPEDDTEHAIHLSADKAAKNNGDAEVWKKMVLTLWQVRQWCHTEHAHTVETLILIVSTLFLSYSTSLQKAALFSHGAVGSYTISALWD